MRAAAGRARSRSSLTPEQRCCACILLAWTSTSSYNGGIGTYIKASSETHAQVKDRANDDIRVDGSELRCKVVSEGGNLGATQAGRILDEKLVLGAIHPSIGQEGVAAGVVGALAADDVLLSTHRGHGHTLAKGAPAPAMMRELFGRAGGSCGGKGGSMHIADFGVGMLGANGVVAANIVIAAGAAHAIKLQGDRVQGDRVSGGRRVVCCIFGDGATNRGPFLEGLNWAASFGLPVLFVCEDNGFAATTRTASTSAGPGPAARARSLGLQAEEVDGNDVLAVDAAATRLVGEIRAGSGPRFLLARTYRMTGHTGADPAAYRPAAEVEAQRAHDPIARLAAHLAEAGVSGAELDADRDAAAREMAAAYDDAKGAPFPDAAEALRDVQDVGSPEREAF